MKSFNPLLVFAFVITTAAGIVAFNLAAITNPTEAQKALSTTCTTILLTGSGAILALVNNEEEQNDKDDEPPLKH